MSTALVLLSLSISQATLGPRGDSLRSVLALSATLLFPALGRNGPGKGHDRLCACLSLTVFGYAVFVAARDHLSLWPLLCNESTRITSSIASMIGIDARLGPSYSGILIGLAFAISFVARAGVALIARWPNERGATHLILVENGMEERLAFHAADLLRDELPAGFDAVLECDVDVYGVELFQ